MSIIAKEHQISEVKIETVVQKKSQIYVSWHLLNIHSARMKRKIKIDPTWSKPSSGD